MDSEFIRETVGKVAKYKKGDGYGFITIGDQSWDDAFFSHRDLEPEKTNLKSIAIGDFVKFNLHKGPKGFVAKEVYQITEDIYFQNMAVSKGV